MFGEINDKIKEIVDLSVLRERVFKDEVNQGLHEGFLDIGDFLEDKKYESSKIEKNILSILKSLDEEILLKLQAVMYLGRDYDSSEGLSPNEVYEILLKNFSADEKDKEVLANTLSSKTCLGSCLTTGFGLLKIKF